MQNLRRSLSTDCATTWSLDRRRRWRRRLRFFVFAYRRTVRALVRARTRASWRSALMCIACACRVYVRARLAARILELSCVFDLFRILVDETMTRLGAFLAPFCLAIIVVTLAAAAPPPPPPPPPLPSPPPPLPQPEKNARRRRHQAKSAAARSRDLVDHKRECRRKRRKQQQRRGRRLGVWIRNVFRNSSRSN